MLKRQFGQTDLHISVCGLGAWAMGGWMWGAQDDSDSVAAIHAALDAGVNWIDTAPIYGAGHSEMVVGKALKELDAAGRPLIFTKFGLGTDNDAMRRSATREEILAECDDSLKRLGIERIDLYQQHWPVEQPIGEIAAACSALIDAGKIRYVGVSNYNVAQMQEWQQTGLPLHSLQTPLSLMKPESTEEIIPFCFEQELGCLAYSPLYRGMLFAKWAADQVFPAGDGRATHKDFSGPRFPIMLQAVDKIAAVAADNELDCAQLCIGVLLCNPGLTACIVGARNAGQGAYIGELGMPAQNKAIKAVEGILWDMRKALDELA